MKNADVQRALEVIQAALAAGPFAGGTVHVTDESVELDDIDCVVVVVDGNAFEVAKEIFPTH